MIIHPSNPLALWQPTPPFLPLTETHIDIWKSPTQLPPDETAYLASLLSPAERQKAELFRDPLKRAESEVSRGLLRRLSAHLLEMDPHALSFEVGPHGKPYLTDRYDGIPIAFNLSHTKDCILIAFGLNRDIGIDVEWMPPNYPWQPIARQFLPPSDVDKLLSLAPADQCHAFFTQWVRSEASLKAIGIGLTHGLTLPNQLDHQGTISTTDLSTGSDHIAAVGSSAPSYSLRLWK